MGKNCVKCGSVGVTCCEMAQERLKTANSLSRIVDRQGKRLIELTRLLGEKDQVIGDLRAKAAA
jgi:hypothetical protein